MKYLVLVGDGMGDYPLAEHQGKTPLELAATPYIDSLCARGELFFNQTVPPVSIRSAPEGSFFLTRRCRRVFFRAVMWPICR